MRRNRRDDSLCNKLFRVCSQLHDYLFVTNLKIAFIGPKGSGKSSFVSPLFENHYLENMNSSEVRCQKSRKSNIRFIVYDIPGGEDFEAKWDHYYKKVDVLVFFIDSTSSEEECSKAKHLLKSLLYRNMWLKKNILILGTKNDLENARACRDLILELDLMGIIDREVACYSVSSKYLTNVDSVEDWLIDQANFLSSHEK